MNKIILKTRNLSKNYINKSAVSNLNITIRKGDIYGLVGKNGSGKTTLIRMILSLTNESSGEIELFDKIRMEDRIKEHARIGAIVETPSFMPKLTARQNLEYYRIQRGIPNKESIEELLNLVGLNEVKNKKVKGFSLGMKQRLGIVLAMIGDPEFLILDEPINGIDPIGIKEIRDVLKKLNKMKNTTILISSHILGELSQLATRYGFINNGVLIEEISSEALEDKCKNYISVKVDNMEKACVVLEGLNCSSYDVLNNGVIRVYDFLDEPYIINQELVKNGIRVYSLQTMGTNLEEYFINLIRGGDINA